MEIYRNYRKYRRYEVKKIIDYIAEELSEAFEKAGYDRTYGKVTLSNRPDLCEYQCNGAMAGAKAYKKAPEVQLQHVYTFQVMRQEDNRKHGSS